MRTVYIGLRHYNRIAATKVTSPDGKKQKKKLEQRDRSEWLTICVPAVVSRELFDKANERLRSASEHVERVVENILVAREMARIDLSIDVLITQPQE